MPTIRLPEESEHGEMVKKVDAMIREISKAPAMTPTSRALGLRPSILMGNHTELAHVMATRALLNLQKRMIALAVAAAKAAPYELYAHTRGLQREYGLDDGQIVVIGGLIQDSVNDGMQKVPVLGDIPLLGGLFRYKTRSHSKTNLMIFLRPTLVRDSRRADAFTSERYDYILGEEGKAKPAHDPILPDMESPTLPPRTAPAIRPTPPLEIEVRPYRDGGRN